MSIPTFPISLRVASQADAAFAYEVSCQTFRPYAEQTLGLWPEDIVREQISRNIDAGIMSVILFSAEPAGIITVEELESYLHLDQLFLLPAFQRNGIGTALVKSVLAHARELGIPVRLCVLRVNPAKRMYERLGFFVISEDPERFYMQSAP